MGLREKNREHLRSEIVHAALALFAKEGFDAVRVIDIVERVGISEKTFFNHFPTKLSVLEAFAQQMLVAYDALLRRMIAQSDRPTVDRLREVVGGWATAYSSGGRHFGDAVRLSGLFFGAEGEIRARQEETQRLLAALIRQGQTTGEIRSADPLQLAELLTSMMLGTVGNWLGKWWGETGNLEDRLLGAFDVFLLGAASQSSHSRRALKARPKARRRRSHRGP